MDALSPTTKRIPNKEGIAMPIVLIFTSFRFIVAPFFVVEEQPYFLF
jgi:hypothetical protein